MPMALTQPIPAWGSAKPLISGYPLVSGELLDWMDGFDSAFVGAVREAEVFARTQLRSAARRLEGWKDIEDRLDVEFDGDDFVYLVHGDEAAALANKLEYGDEETPPTGFLRKHALSQAPLLSEFLTARISSGVPSA